MLVKTTLFVIILVSIDGVTTMLMFGVAFASNYVIFPIGNVIVVWKNNIWVSYEANGG